MFFQSANNAFERHGIIIRIHDGKIVYRLKDVVQLFPKSAEDISRGGTFLSRIKGNDTREAYVRRRSQAKIFTELYDF